MEVPPAPAAVVAADDNAAELSIGALLMAVMFSCTCPGWFASRRVKVRRGTPGLRA